MFDNPFFQSIIALATLYLVFSQLTLSLIELPAGWQNWRGKYLHKNLKSVLGNKACDAFYNSSAIKGLMSPTGAAHKEDKAWPAYVSETLFAQTIIDWVSGEDAGGATTAIAKFQGGLNKLDADAATAVQNAANTQLATEDKKEINNFTSLLRPLYTAALAAAATAPEQSSALQKNLEAWFHEYGERMTGWYKRDQRWPLFWTGLLVAVLADVDTVRLAHFIFDSDNAKVRTALVEMGVAATQKAAPAATPTSDSAAASPAESTLKDLATKAVQEFQTTLDALPKASLPLGPFRWLDRSIVHTYKLRSPKTPGQDTLTIKGANGTRIPDPKRDSVQVSCWAATADDFGMPVYAQRWQINQQTHEVNDPYNAATIGKIIGGWLLTAFALMLGAPFWFDTLCRFVNIRNIGIKPAKAAGAS
jgi:hypothetical protein